jgi:hypothetical protein
MGYNFAIYPVRDRGKGVEGVRKGQIWKMGEAHLEITHLGKRLTEFKRYRDIGKRRAIPEMAHIEEVQTMLVMHQAALIQQARVLPSVP